MKHTDRFPLYPLLFAAYPVLFLYQRNMDEVRLCDAVKPLGASLAFALIVIWLARLRLREPGKAALASSAVMVWFYSYGHVFALFGDLRLGGLVLGRHMVVYPVYCLGFAVVMLLIARTRRGLETLSRCVAIGALTLVAVCSLQIMVYKLGPQESAKKLWNKHVSNYAAAHPLRVMAGKTPPDIYYIILDNYSRADVLKEEIGYDNSRFLEYLKAKGFYVASESCVRRPVTVTSLAAALNLNEPDSLNRSAGIPRGCSWKLQYSMISNCLVGRLLRNAGYRFVTFASGYAVTGRMQADDVLRKSGLSVTEFDGVLINTTALATPMSLLPTRLYSSVGEIAQRRNKITFAFDKLREVPRMKEPTFAFAHVIATHPPFVFDADGDIPAATLRNLSGGAVRWAYDKSVYIDSVRYTNKQMERAIDSIISRSETPPIIIIQADHGMKYRLRGVGPLSLARKCAILNAYYLPDGGNRLLYPSISPVNSFRVVFNRYFGADYRLL